MDLVRLVERYLARTVGVLTYFTGFPLLTAAIFSLPGSPGQSLVFLIAAAGMFAAAAMILEAVFGRGAIKILTVSSSWPFIAFLLFNISVTAVFARAAYETIKAEASRLVFSNVITHVLGGYERVVPKLWVTAVLYGAATLGFAIALREQRRALRDRSRTDRDLEAELEDRRDPSWTRSG